jgi:hypothetical protein
VIDSDLLDVLTVAVGLVMLNGDFVSDVPRGLSLIENSPRLSFSSNVFPVVFATELEIELFATILVLTAFCPITKVPSVCDPTSPINKYYDRQK